MTVLSAELGGTLFYSKPEWGEPDLSCGSLWYLGG